MADKKDVKKLDEKALKEVAGGEAGYVDPSDLERRVDPGEVAENIRDIFDLINRRHPYQH